MNGCQNTHAHPLVQVGPDAHSIAGRAGLIRLPLATQTDPEAPFSEIIFDETPQGSSSLVRGWSRHRGRRRAGASLELGAVDDRGNPGQGGDLDGVLDLKRLAIRL